MKHYIFFILLVFSSIAQAQKHDYNWLTGYSFLDDSLPNPFGITRMDFNTSSLNPKFIYDTFKRIDFLGTNNNMSDVDGNYLFSYNGSFIEDYTNKPIKNGTITDVPRFENFNQIAIIIPSTMSNKYFLYHTEYKNFGIGAGGENLYFSEIDMKNTVSIKRKMIYAGKLELGFITAIKHANGTDNWIVLVSYESNEFIALLMEASSGKIITQTKSYVPEITFKALGEISTNHSGTLIALSYNYSYTTMLRSYLDIFNFNRNTGLLDLKKSFLFDGTNAPNMFGVAFSPNSKYLYVSRINNVFQIDLTQASLVLDTVATYDGFEFISTGNFLYRTWFGFIEPAPDGRIYGTTSCCTQRYLFTIDKPNLKGAACDVRQHIHKITMHNCLPSFPNYRLGPLDGSVSDTLGIDNIPVAEFRYDQDTIAYRQFAFTNLSYYEPEEWWWDFGDGSTVYYTTQWDTAITHIFPRDGIYDVCLRAKNKNGEHSICKTLHIGTTATHKTIQDINISIHPNPVHELMIVQLTDYNPELMLLYLYDPSGHLITTKRIYEGSNLIDAAPLQQGIYYATIVERNKLVKTIKVIKN